MADIGSKMEFFLLVVALCLIPDSLSLDLSPGLGLDLGGPLNRDLTPCQKVCKATFQDQDQSYCYRGCRLMSVLDYLNGEEASLEEVRDSCLHACSESYGMLNASSCAFGCQGQLPSIEDKRKQLAKFSEQMSEDSLFGFPSRLIDYPQRMMDCMLDQLNHQISYGWMIISTSTSDVSAGEQHVVIIRGGPVRVFGRLDIEQASVQKTSSYVEANLAMMAGGPDSPDGKGSHLMDADTFMFSGSETDRQYVSSDWLSCLSAKTGLSKMSILFMLFTLLIVLMWFIVGFIFPTSSERKGDKNGHQKLSIYGDLEYLTTLDTKAPLSFTGPPKFGNFAPSLPVKMQEI